VKLISNLVWPLVVIWVGVAAAAVLPGDDIAESPDGLEAVKVYYTGDEALAKVFTDADSLWVEEWTPTPEEKTAMEQSLAWRIEEENFFIHRASKDGQDLGFAMITEEKGRFKPITFIVKTSAEQKVNIVLIMVYRESRGDGVKRQRFLKQFRDKEASDHLRLNRDIVAVSGATMSSRALAIGVKKVLAILEMRYPPTKAAP
jgi:Na+-translocating ferredoxin:NAD+ oxidoreductase RnfG subunit